MCVNYLVFYRGRANDRQSFVDRYRDIHVPILKRFPGIQGISLLTPINWKDKHPVTPGQFTLIVQMKFASIEALELRVAITGTGRGERRFLKSFLFLGERSGIRP